MTSRVLLVINAQVGHLASDAPGSVLGGPGPIPHAPAIRDNIALVLAHARAAPADADVTVIHLRNAGDPGDPDAEGSPGWALLHAPLPGEPVVDKRKSNAFAGTRLAELVAPDAEVVVVGLMSEYSIKSTCSAALQRGNTVLLMRGAHGTYDHVELVDGPGRLTPAEKISAQVEDELDRAGAMVLDMKYLPGLFEGR
ncbi:Isochorismatase-like protein [Mycena galericulata]|nr:Isochorismatase-like protein [Mycena galericulata]